MPDEIDETTLLKKAGAPQIMTMDESACPSDAAIAVAKRTGYTAAGGLIGAGVGYAACGIPSIGAAIVAGLCFLAGPEIASCCRDSCKKCDNEDDNFLVDPKALTLSRFH